MILFRLILEYFLTMQKKIISSYDDTKKMLNTLRKLNETKSSFNTLREQEESTSDDITVINDVDVKLVSSDTVDLELTEEQKNTISGLIDSFREQVSQIADLKPGFTFNETQIRLDGSITDLDINFVFIVGDEGGLYLNADMLLIDNDVITTITKLSKFELTFRDTIEPLLRERKTN